MIGWLMNMGQLAKWELVGETEVLGANLPPVPTQLAFFIRLYNVTYISSVAALPCKKVWPVSRRVKASYTNHFILLSTSIVSCVTVGTDSRWLPYLRPYSLFIRIWKNRMEIILQIHCILFRSVMTFGRNDMFPQLYSGDYNIGLMLCLESISSMVYELQQLLQLSP
jgi:hypothetical protein